MKAYLIVTGLIFTLLAVVHVWRAIVEWPQPTAGSEFLLSTAALVLIPGALGCWAWRLVGKN